MILNGKEDVLLVTCLCTGHVVYFGRQTIVKENRKAEYLQDVVLRALWWCLFPVMYALKPGGGNVTLTCMVYVYKCADVCIYA